MLVGAALFAASLRNVRSLDMAFRSKGVLAVNLDFTGMSARPWSEGSSDVVFKQIEEAVRSLSGVKSVAVSTFRSVPGPDSSFGDHTGPRFGARQDSRVLHCCN
jgi:hypothetical protein